MRKLLATLLFIFWPGLMLSPGQSIFFSQNVRPAATVGLALVNASYTPDITIDNNVTSQTLGFTTGSGHFFMAMGYTGSQSSITGATLEPSGTALTCPTANQLHGTKTLVWLCYLPNGPSGQTSVNWGYSESNGSIAISAFSEYSGMSLTAAPVNTAVQCPGAFTGATTWSCGPYTATANNLVWTTCGTSFGGGSVSNYAPWTDVLEGEGSPNFINFWYFDQLSPAAGSYTGSSTYPNTFSGMNYDCMIGSFE
jgi:hypothetical protein